MSDVIEAINSLQKVGDSRVITILSAYAKLEAEAQALRDEVEAANDRADTLEHRMMGMMTRHFAESWRNRDTQKALDGYLSAGIAELERERDAALAEVAALRARVVMFTGFGNDVIIETFRRNGFLIELGASYSVKGQIAQLLNALDELARLNGKAVSEGLLRRLSDLFPADMGDDGSGRAGWLPHLRETVAELRALLGEGKEHE